MKKTTRVAVAELPEGGLVFYKDKPCILLEHDTFYRDRACLLFPDGEMWCILYKWLSLPFEN